MADDKDLLETLEKFCDALVNFQEVLEKRRFGPKGYQSPTRSAGRSSRKKMSQKKFTSGERRVDRQRPIPRQSEQEQRAKEKDQIIAEMKRKLHMKKAEETLKIDSNGQWQIKKYGDMCVSGGSGMTAMGAVGAANKSEK